MNTSVSDWVAEFFKQVGIDKVFLYPGGTIAPVVNACLRHGIQTEVFKNEQGAVYAALAYARVTGETQIAMVTSGPGVTNAITPLADAYYDSTPLMLLTGQIGTSDLAKRKAVRQRGFQEVPTVALTTAITKRAKCIISPDEVFTELPRSFELTSSGRPGPVVIDFPMDIQRAELQVFPVIRKPTEYQNYSKEHNAPLDQVLEIARAAEAAERPVIFLGQGALTAGKFELYSHIAEVIDARVVTSLLGIGSFDVSNSRCLGYAGHTGHLAANRAIYESDFVIVLGARLDVRQTGTVVDQFVPNGRVAWINSDIDELENPRVETEWRVNSDVGIFCEALAAQLQARLNDIDRDWVNTIDSLRNKYCEDRPLKSGCALQPRLVLQVLSSYIANKPIAIVTGVGCHQHWAARHLPYHPSNCHFLTSGGHGTMGYDLPSAIGVAMAQPERQVLCIVGDGSFLMNIQEMAALRERNLDVKILVFNNHRLGIVSQFQLITWGDDPTTKDFGAPDFVSISRGFGVPADQLESPDKIDEKIRWLLRQEGPALLNIEVDPQADVVPMLLAGQVMGDMWMGRDSS